MFTKKMTLQSRQKTVPIIFNNNLPSWNALIVGDHGTGKKTILSEMIIQEFLDIKNNKVRPKLSIICSDYYAEEYVRNLQVIGPKLVSINEEFKINPFNLENKSRYPNKKKFNQLCEFFSGDKNVVINLKDFYKHNYIHHNNSPKDFLEYVEYFFKENFPISFTKYGSFKIADLVQLKEGECVPSFETEKTLLTFLEIILSDDKELNGFQRFDPDMVLFHLRNIFEKDTYPTLQDLYNEIENNCAVQRDNLKNALNPYLKSSFNTTESFKITQDVSVYSLKEVRGVMKNIYALLIMDLAKTFHHSSDGKNFMVFSGDEFFSHNSIRTKYSFLEGLRVSRKNTVSIISVINSLKTLELESNLGKAIICNMSQYIYTGLKDKSDIVIFEKAMGLTQLPNDLGAKFEFDKKTKTKFPNKYKFLHMTGSSGVL